MTNDGFDKWRDPKIKLRTKNERLGMKYAKRRAALKKAKEPHIALWRKFSKASPLAKTGIIAGLAIPKAIFLGMAYAGGKSGGKSEAKKQPKKYMVG